MIAAAVLSAVAVACLNIAMARMGPPPVEAADALSKTVVDRKGRLLRAFTTPDGRWRLGLEVTEVDPRYFDFLFAFEDRRFYDHRGVDPVGFLRAAGQLVRNGRIVSGGSTLTMQVARLLEGRHERTTVGKLHQIVRAFQLEEQFTKKDILRLYLRLAPMGGNIEGVRAASLAYFGKEPARLSAGESALLVALPQAPESRRPDRFAAAAQRARDRVLDRAVERGVLSAAEAQRAKAERVPDRRREFPKLAPHVAESEVAREPGKGLHKLTLDRDVQAALERLARDQARALGPRISTALLAVENATGRVVAYVGSSDYMDEQRFGPVDMVQAVRSPGSTLKPLIYGLAFEAGLAHPETLIEDRPVRFGTYRPENFDEDFHGTVTVREALGQSLNIPAVKALEAVGPQKLLMRMKRAHVEALLPDAGQPTLAIALGGLGMRLEDLASLYAGLARGGDPVHVSWRQDETPAVPVAGAPPKRRLLSPVAAWYVTDILRDAPPPPNTKGGLIAYKTGTSYGYRDAWAAGYDGRHTIVVWAGRADGASTPGLIGRLGAAPILFDAFQRLAEHRAAFAPAPGGVMAGGSASLPRTLKRFRDGAGATASGPYIEPPVLIAFPPDRAELDMSERAEEPLVLKADGGALPLTWLVDGAPIASDSRRRDVAWTPGGRGFVKVQVIDAKGRVDRVTVRLN